MATRGWEQIVIQKRNELDKLDLPSALDVTDFGDFEAKVRDLCARYAARGLAKFITVRLAPHFDHIRSFTNAITAVTQICDYASLVWGSLNLILEVACRFAESLSDAFNMLDQVHQLIPHFEGYIDLFPADESLKEALASLYEDTLDFYIHLLRYLKKSSSRNFFKHFVSSSHKHGMKSITTSFQQHLLIFESKATLVSRRKNALDHAQILTHLSIAPAKTAQAEFPLYMVPYRRNPEFYGRDGLIAELHQQVYENQFGCEPLSSVLHGIGGVGKTQVALEYTYRYRSSFQCIFWLPAEDPVALSRAYCTIGQKICLFSADDQLKTGQPEIAAVQEWLRHTDKTWLLVFDNVHDWTNIAAYWPSISRLRGSVIMTSQRPGNLMPWANSKLNVSHFSIDTGSRLLLRALGIPETDREQVAESREITQLVGGLPLYLTHISGHISQSQSTLREYLCLIHDSSNIWKGKGPHDISNWMYERTIDTVFDVALTKLGFRARRLANVLTFLNPDGVPEDILFPEQSKDRLGYIDCPDKETFFDIMADLRQRQLITREKLAEGNMLTMHRSIQEVILNKLNQDLESRSEAFLCALTSLRRFIPRPSLLIQAETKKWYEMEPYLPQLLSLRRSYSRSKPRLPGVFAFAEMLFDVGMNMWDRGLTRDGRDVLRTAEEVLDSINYEAMSSVRANIHLVLAVILDDFGISGRSEALARRQKALKIRQYLVDHKAPEEKVPEDDILLFAAVMDLSGSYRHINQFEPLKELCCRCYSQYQVWGDIDSIPYEYAKYYNDMSFERAYHHDNEKAAEFSRRAWVLMEMGDPTALLSNQYKLTWSLRLYHCRQHEKAIKELTAILNYRLKSVGWLNYLTLQSQLALGILHCRENNFAEAEQCISGVLEPATRSILPEETIVRAKYYLGLVWAATPGHEDDASRLMTEAKKAMETLIQADPPNTETSIPDDESALYDYLVHAGLRVSLFRKKESEGKKVGSLRFPNFGRWHKRELYGLGQASSQSFNDLRLNSRKADEWSIDILPDRSQDV